MKRRVFVTGTGIVLSIGMNTGETAMSLQKGISGISGIENLDTIHEGVIPAGEIKHSNSDLASMLSLHEGEYSRTFLLGLIAAKEAAALLKDNDRYRTGFISATTVGGMDLTEEYYLRKNRGETPDRSMLLSHDCGFSTQMIARHLGIRDFVSTVSTACSSSLNSIIYASMLIKNGIIDRALAGGSDCLSRFTLNGFNTLKILDTERCNPFDENRNGLNLGEGAAYLCLESEESAMMHKEKILCELKGSGNACDAYHQTAISDDGTGPYLSMQKALSDAGLSGSGIDYINLHGTGTQNNDLSEGRAIERLFDGVIPLYSSTKSYTGHTLGAAGAVESIFSIIMLKENSVYPNLGFRTRMKELNSSPVNKVLTGLKINNVLSNSFGFGGNNSSIILGRVE